MSRPSRETVYMEIAHAVSLRSTCRRRKVGCVLVDERGHLLATGYNGIPSGLPHCNESIPHIENTGYAGEQAGVLDDLVDYPNACNGSEMKSGEGLDKCFAVHAEQNALLQCKDVYQIDKCFVTTQPCIHCVKLLLNTTCKTIYFQEEYSHPDAMKLWEDAGRKMYQI